MKFRVRFNRRHNLYVTLFACGVSIWLMVARFGLEMDTLVSFTIMTIVLLGGLVGTAALLAIIIRKFRDRHE